MGRAMKCLLKKLLRREIFRSMVSWAPKFALKNSENSPAPFLLHTSCTLANNKNQVATKT